MTSKKPNLAEWEAKGWMTIGDAATLKGCVYTTMLRLCIGWPRRQVRRPSPFTGCSQPVIIVERWRVEACQLPLSRRGRTPTNNESHTHAQEAH